MVLYVLQDSLCSFSCQFHFSLKLHSEAYLKWNCIIKIQHKNLYHIAPFIWKLFLHASKVKPRQPIIYLKCSLYNLVPHNYLTFTIIPTDPLSYYHTHNIVTTHITNCQYHKDNSFRSYSLFTFYGLEWWYSCCCCCCCCCCCPHWMLPVTGQDQLSRWRPRPKEKGEEGRGEYT